MQYLLMCCFDEKKWDAIPESQRGAIMQEYGAVVDGLIENGQYLAGAKLRPTAAATSVRAKNGKPVVSDGPFAETKEQLGGYHLIDCRDLDEAIAIAKRIPTIPHGGLVEVRPIEHITK